MPLRGIGDSRTLLLERLEEIVRGGWHRSCRLDRNGQIMEYAARNGGGYTLEALLGIIPNSNSEPDFMGWEMKAFSGNRITLMTPEPDGGYCGDRKVEAFVRKYGHGTGDDTLYFTGTHRVGEQNRTTSMTMRLDGFDVTKGKIVNPSGGIVLVGADGEDAAVWSFSHLLLHWSRKHAQAAYLGYEMEKEPGFPRYRYLSPAWLGKGQDFAIFLQVMHAVS